MKIIRDGIRLCGECHIVAVNGDASGIDDPARVAEVLAGLDSFGGHLVPAYDSETGEGIHEFARGPCGCCGSNLAGSFHEFALLGAE